MITPDHLLPMWERHRAAIDHPIRTLDLRGRVFDDRPFQLGSRRIGPDLHRVGGKYPDGWHYRHMVNPRDTSEGSVMPSYPWLADDPLDLPVEELD